MNSDEQVRANKAQGIMSHAERFGCRFHFSSEGNINHARRLEAVRHCRWVDEVVPEAPWVIDEVFMKKFDIDYVAHDEEPYADAGHDDVYGYVKNRGLLCPSRLL